MHGAGGERVLNTRLRIGQNCRAMCRKKSDLRPLMPWAIATARDALSNDWRESAAHFERLAKQALVLTTEPRAR